ncbi:MAG: hypothetical protein ACTJLM_04870 [Ehrlichia sp.]
MKKNIVKGIAVSLVLGYVSAVSTLYFTKFIVLDFNNVKDIAKIVAPFAVPLIGAALLLSGKLDKYIGGEKNIGVDRVNYKFACNKFNELSKKILSDLKSLANEPVGQESFKDTVESTSESSEEIQSTRPVFFFSKFRGYFDSLLYYAEDSEVLKTSEGKLVVNEYRLRAMIPNPTAIIMVLSAQLMMKNPMLSIMYPKDKISYIRALSQISVEHYSEKDRQDAAKEIEELLNTEVYCCTNYIQLYRQLLTAQYNVIQAFKSSDKVSAVELRRMSPSERRDVLIVLLLISRLKYYVTSEDAASHINNADSILGEYIIKDPIGDDVKKFMFKCAAFKIKDEDSHVIFKVQEGRIIKVGQPGRLSVESTPSTALQEKGVAAALPA